MGHYKSKLGFFRIIILKILTRMAIVAMNSQWMRFVYLIERLHFRIYTGMSLKKSLKEHKSIAIAAVRRTRKLFYLELSKQGVSEEVCQMCVGLAYMLYIKRQMKASCIDLIINKQI